MVTISSVVAKLAARDALTMRFIDSHTGGEPTRTIIDGCPDLGAGPLSERAQRLARDHDEVRRSLILEPRGFDAIVGAVLVPATRDDCAAGVIFCNNTGYLGMCGHGAMGVVVTLAYLGRLASSRVKLETPVGIIEVELLDRNTVSVKNVPSHCHRRDVEFPVDGLGAVRGDIAWGGNWFFLTEDAPCPLALDHRRQLIDAAERIRQTLAAAGIRGGDGAVIDHIEFIGEPLPDTTSKATPRANSRNFVLCPGGAYDRSPCGTGTSAKLACLAARGLLNEHQDWIQEGITGSRFVASYEHGDDGHILPRITGQAYVCTEAAIIHDPADPLAYGFG